MEPWEATPTRPLDDGERDRWFVGTWLRIVAGAADTDGMMTVMEQRAPQGFSPPLHVHHHEDTALFVLDGELSVRVGDARLELAAGGFAWLPRGVPHSFLVRSPDARLIELAAPGGVDGFHVAASDRAENSGLPPAAEPDIARLLAAAGPYGAELLGPPMVA